MLSARCLHIWVFYKGAIRAVNSCAVPGGMKGHGHSSHLCFCARNKKLFRPARGEAQVISGHCRSQPWLSNQQRPTTCWKKAESFGLKTQDNDLMENEPRKMKTWCPFYNNAVSVWARQMLSLFLPLIKPWAWKCLTSDSRKTWMSVMYISSVGQVTFEM